MQTLSMSQRMGWIGVLAFGLLVGTLRGISVKDAATALDCPDGVTLVELVYWKYSLGEDHEIIVDEETQEEIYTQSSGKDSWAVQKETSGGGMTADGVSCLVSTIKTGNVSFDALMSRIVLTVSTPGTFGFKYKTSTDSGDEIRWYLDGELLGSESGYGTEQEWEEAEIDIQGLAASGPYEGTAKHEIVIAFYKDEPKYEYNDKDRLVYVPDGPEKPNWADYDGDTEWYQEDMAEYNSFKNCIWVDQVTWQPTEPEMSLSPEGGFKATEPYDVDVMGNLGDFGYVLHYTTDGTEPTAESPLYDETDSIAVEQSCRIIVKAFEKTADETEHPVEPELRREGDYGLQVKRPTLEILAEESTESQVMVKAACETEGATIWLALDGGELEPAAADGRLAVSREAAVVAVAKKAGWEDSETAMLTVTRLASPVITGEGTDKPWFEGQLTVSCQAAGGTVFVDDGGGWRAMDGPLTLTETTALRFVAREAGKLESPVTDALYYKVKETRLGEGPWAVRDGWNALALTWQLLPASRLALMERFRFWELEPTACVWSVAQNLEPGKVYWFHAERAAAVEPLVIKGFEPNREPTVLRQGWNMVFADETGDDACWRWEADRQCYVFRTLEFGEWGWRYLP